MNRRERRSWDKYVSEARETFSEVEIGGETLRVYAPSIDGLNELSRAEREGDVVAALVALFGEEHADTVIAEARKAPVTALQALMKDILSDLGLSNSPE